MSRSDDRARVPLGIWAASFGILLLLSGLADQLYRNLPPTKAEQKQIRECFQAKRLNKLEQPGVVVMGTSLVKYGLPFDNDMNKIAWNQGLKIHFIRFTCSSGTRRDFSVLLDPILRANPQWVFIQAEPLVLELCSRYFPRRILETVRKPIHFAAKLAVLELAHAFGVSQPCDRTQQDDVYMHLEQTATIKTIHHPLYDSYDINVPQLPEFTRFIAKARKKNIRVILLEMNRSREGTQGFGPEFRHSMDQALYELAASWNIPLWQFRGDISLKYYVDRAHLNRRGRRIFTRWFLARLKAEQGND